MKIKSLLFCAALLNASAYTLQESFAQALEHDKQLKGSYYETKISSARAEQAKANLLPSLHLTGGLHVDKYSRFGKKVDESYKNYGVTLRQQVFRPGLYIAAKNERKRQEASEYAYQNAFSDLALRLLGAYFEYLFAHERSELASSFHAANVARLEQMSKSFKQGLVSKMDFLESKIRMDKSFLDLSKAQKDELTARIALMNITGVEPEPSKGVKSLDLDYFSSLDLAKYQVVESNLEYKQRQIAAQIAANEVLSRQAEFLPQVDFSASFTDNRYQNERYFGDKRDQFSANLTFSMPLYTSGFMQARLEEAKYERLSALAKQEGAADEISLKQQKALNEFKIALEQVKISRESLNHAQLYEQALERGYSLGLKDLVELLDARSRAYEARAEAIKSAQNLVANYLVLESLIGAISEELIAKLSQMFS